MDKKIYKRISFLFPGQGAQYPGMAKDFVNQFSLAQLVFEEADDILKRSLSNVVFNGSEEELTLTKNSQLGIYVSSIAILRVVSELYNLKPFVCSGLSLGEYTALTASEILPYQETLSLVQYRSEYMHEACEETKGSMIVVIGLENSVVEEMVNKLNLANDLWIANFNCPGQVVLSGTSLGIEAGGAAAKKYGAKRVLPLQVAGAFHSGLMQVAENRLNPFISSTPFQKGSSQLVMNVSGDFVDDLELVRTHLIKQVTHSVRWEQGIRAIESQDVDLFIEFGPGKTLNGLNKRIGVKAPTLSIEKVEDLALLDHIIQ
ncbi:ACP S-malonyltransferase [Candidatus Protochlamydia sp. R18]|uniref:ACP S-malonyltransferase n=1 Tax=Candidatus Protochlamydia sp. R18 TaxID=1353977 RepID=UPI0005A7FC7E|nr:ACP S-malonyltransferase [Candidatus Protochlamydia sp. R18]